MSKKFFKAVFLQFSGTVGAGIFALPYLFYHSNFNFTFLSLIFLTIITAILNIFYVDIILHTKGDHQLAGYSQIYLGSKYKILSLINILFISIGALLAYIKLSSKFLIIIFPQFTLISASLFFIFFLLLIHFLKVKFIIKLSNFVPIILFLILFFLFFKSLLFNNFDINGISPSFSFFGVLVFALSGFTIIPEMEEVLREHQNVKRLLKISSIVGLLLASFSFLIFSYSIIKISGSKLSPDAVSGLFNASPILGIILAIFGLLVLFQASRNFLLVLKEIFYRDFLVSPKTSILLSSFFPFLSFFFINTSFVQIISFTGSVTIFLSALIICLIRLKLKHDWLTNVLVFIVLSVFIFGLVGELT